MTPDSEKKIEARLTREVTRLGGMSVKLTSQFHRGLPDRLVLMPEGRAYFVELKTTGKKPTELQAHTHAQLRRLGYFVAVVDSFAALDDFLLLVKLEGGLLA